MYIHTYIYIYIHTHVCGRAPKAPSPSLTERVTT